MTITEAVKEIVDSVPRNLRENYGDTVCEKAAEVLEYMESEGYLEDEDSARDDISGHIESANVISVYNGPLMEWVSEDRFAASLIDDYVNEFDYLGFFETIMGALYNAVENCVSDLISEVFDLVDED